MNIIWILKDLYACKGDLQVWVNRRFKDDDIVMVRRTTTDHVVTTEGLKFRLQGQSELGDLMTEYEFDDLTKDDIVLDLGANVGGFAIRAAQKARHVYAVEPLFYKELEDNIALNKMQDKITILRLGVGYGEEIQLKYHDKKEIVKTYTLPEILKMTGRITFLKVDIEGAEWTIKPEHLGGIDRIEFEAHCGTNSCLTVNKDLIEYIKKNWRTTETRKRFGDNSFWIHASKRG
jgi:FkbM family methyltransferase